MDGLVTENLTNKLNSLSLFRPLGLPQNLGAYILLVMSGNLQDIDAFISAMHDTPEALIIPDISRIPESIELEDGRFLPVKPVTWLETVPQYAKVFFAPANPHTAAAFLTAIARFLVLSDCTCIYIAGNEPPAHSMRQAYKEFYELNKDKLQDTLNLFADEPSRKTYLGRIKGIITGNAGYIPIAPHPEYFHPLVKPEAGDVLLDGGVSDMVGAQKDMAAAVGSSGVIYGFEPIPNLYIKAKQQLEPIPNYNLVCAGLALKDGWTFFEDMGDSSHMLKQQKDSGTQVRCHLVSIDSFCRQNKIAHVDCIKLDVEGAELETLQGARGIIKRDYPKLIVCLYHKPQDMYEIPQFIKKIAPDYKFYLAHSSCQFMDTVLYCKK